MDIIMSIPVVSHSCENSSYKPRLLRHSGVLTFESYSNCIILCMLITGCLCILYLSVQSNVNNWGTVMNYGCYFISFLSLCFETFGGISYVGCDNEDDGNNNN